MDVAGAAMVAVGSRLRHQRDEDARGVAGGCVEAGGLDLHLGDFVCMRQVSDSAAIRAVVRNAIHIPLVSADVAIDPVVGGGSLVARPQNAHFAVALYPC